MKKAKFVFFGSSPLSSSYLDELKKYKIIPHKIVTLPPAPAGRGRKLKENATETWAKNNSVHYIYWENSKQILDELSNENYDFALVFAFGKILKKELLEAKNFRLGFINLHPSLLPCLRGPSPIRSALLLDQKDYVGITYIQMDEKMDHGPIILQEKFEPASWPLPGRKLDTELVKFGAKILADKLENILEEKVALKEQNHDKATFTKFFKKQDCEIALDNIKEDGEIVGKDMFIACACDENPAPFFFVNKNGKQTRVKISEIKSEDGKIKIVNVIPEGKKEISWENFKNLI